MEEISSYGPGFKFGPLHQHVTFITLDQNTGIKNQKANRALAKFDVSWAL